MSNATEELRDAGRVDADLRIRAFGVGAAHMCEAFEYYAAARREIPNQVLRPLDEITDRAIAAQKAGDEFGLQQHLAEMKEKIASILAAHSVSNSAFDKTRKSLEQAAASIMQAAPRPEQEIQ